jgi:hypothetical protein
MQLIATRAILIENSTNDHSALLTVASSSIRKIFSDAGSSGK